MAVQGLDRAVAPPADKARQMLNSIGGRWWNVYIGGPESGGHGWTPALVREYVKHGIDRFMLTYVGRQHRGPLTRAQGQADAHDAVRIARSFGYSGRFPLCLDVEMGTFNSAPSATVEYSRAWCATVRDAGVRPGVYANPGPLQAMARGKVPADFVWIASWVAHDAEPHDPHAAASMPAGLWSKPGQRAWQYAGASGNRACAVLGLNVDINVADLGCLALPPGAAAAARARLVRRGAKGELVERLTGRLSYLCSRRTGEPYLDGRRSVFDARVESALKAFQGEHGLTVNGVYGQSSARALRRAVKLRKERRKGAVHGPRTKTPAAHKPAPGRARLRSLVEGVRHLDAETDRAWKTLVAYGEKRSRLLAELHDRPAAAADAELSELTTILLRIEDKLEALVEAEQRDAAQPQQAATAPPAQTAAPEAVTAGSAGGAGDPPAAGATMYQASAPVPGGPPPMPEAPTEAASAGNGGGVESPPALRRRKLTELSDTELAQRIEHLDAALDRTRTVLMRRYARVERELAVLVPPQRTEPAHPGHGPVQPKPRPKPKDKIKPPTPKVPAHHTDEVRRLQGSLNKFSARYLEDVGPLIVDGVKGHATNRRICTTKFYLGYAGKEQRSGSVTSKFVRRMRHPRSGRYSNPAMLTRAFARRRAQRKAAKMAAKPRAGVAKFDNRPVAAWIKPHLEFAREQGWSGTVNSGWRDPAYSERLCYAMCGAPRCPGKCAGRSSNHAGSTPGAGAVDVSDYVRFGQLMRRSPHSPRIFNALGAQDPVHFSASGR